MSEQPTHRTFHLESEANRWGAGLNRTLSGANIQYAIVKAVRGPQAFTFRLGLGDAGQLNKLTGMSEQLALNMGVERVRVHRTLGLVDVEVALPKSLRRALPARCLAQKGGSWVALGQTPTGTPVHINLAGNRTCHTLISGATGSGKTFLERLIAWALAAGNEPDQAQFILIDGKGGVKWRGFDHEIHLAHPIIGENREAIAALLWLLTELDRRKQDGRSSPRIFIVIDELAELIALGGDPVSEAVARLVKLGREFGIHVIAATQHPEVSEVGSSAAKANFVMRLTGQVRDANAAYLATGVRLSGAEQLVGNGDFLVVVSGEVHRLQVALVSDRDIYKLPRRETTPVLPLAEVAEYDPDRVLDMTPSVPVEPDHVATALTVPDPSIRWLKERLGIGQYKATVVQRFAMTVMERLRELGYSVYPLKGEVA